MPHNPYRDYGCARTFLNRPRRWRSSASDYGACCSEARFGQGSARAHWAKPSCVNASLSRRHSVQCYCLTSNAVATDEHHSYIINKGLSRWESNVGQANYRNYKSGRPGSNRRRPAWEAGILPLNYSRLTNELTVCCTIDQMGLRKPKCRCSAVDGPPILMGNVHKS